MDEFDDLVGKICGANTSAESRSYAEQRLLEILSDRIAWKNYSDFLYSANDTVCFFLCIGFQRMVWRHWRDISMEDKVLLNKTIVQTLQTRQNLQIFAKSKLQQVLATICACSCSLEPVLGLIVDADKPGALTGIATMRTVLDLILSDEPKLIPDYKAPLLSAIHEILVPLTNLACSASSLALQSYNEQSKETMLTALELLKIIIAKLQIGNHISSDVINLLFTTASLGAEPNSPFHSCALSAIEALTEIMSKRYIPPDNASNTNSTTNGNPSSISSGGVNSMLLEIVVKSVSLLKKFRLNHSIDDSPIVLALMEFISVFSESHLERCISLSNMSPVASTPTSSKGGIDASLNQSIALFFEELVALSSISMDPTVLHKIVSVWNRVISLGTVKDTLMKQTQLCLSIVSHLLQACLAQTNSHLQDDIEDLVDDFSEATQVDPHVKLILAHISERKDGKRTSTNTSMTNGVSVHGSTTENSSSTSSGRSGGIAGNHSDVLGREEHSYVGTSLREDVHHFVMELASSSDVAGWLSQSIPSLVVQNIALISNQASSNMGDASAVAVVDLHYLIQLLPLASVGPQQLIAQLVNLALQLVESNMHNNGKPLVVLEMQCCQIAAQFFQTSGVVPTSAQTVTQEAVDAMQNLFVMLTRCLTHVCSTSSNSCPYTVMASVTILFMQAVAAYKEVWDHQAVSAIKRGVDEPLIKILDQETCVISRHLPIEIYVLLICAQDVMFPQTVAPLLVNRSLELANLLDLSYVEANIPPGKLLIEDIMRVIAAMDTLSRNHSTSKPQRRQLLVSLFSPLQQAMGKIVQTLLRALILASTAGAGNSGQQQYAADDGPCPMSLLCYAAKLAVSLATGLLQSLGKKTFGRMASDVINVCVDFVENSTQIITNPNAGTNAAVSVPLKPSASEVDIDGLSRAALTSSTSGGSALSKVLFEGTGLLFVKQCLELTRVLAESTAATSPTANAQAMATHRLLLFVAGELNEERVCTELLQPTLKAGVVAIGCYWQKTQKALPFLAAISSQQQFSIANAASEPSLPDINGENVRPIVLLVTQLCVGSLSPNVPPQDTLAALEGLLQLGQQHKLFSMTWFQNQCWGTLLNPCLRAVLLRIHNMHRGTLEDLLIALVTAGEQSYTSTASGERSRGYSGDVNSPRDSFQSTVSSSVGSGGDGGLSREETYAKHQEFWIKIGSELVSIASEFGCGDMANHTLYSVLNSYQAAAVAAEQQRAALGISPSAVGINNTAFSGSTSPIGRGPGSSQGTSVVIDMKIFIDKVVCPISSEIVRRS